MNLITARVLYDLRQDKIRQAKKLLIKIDMLRAKINSSSMRQDIKDVQLAILRENELRVENILIQFKAMQSHDAALSLNTMLD